MNTHLTKLFCTLLFPMLSAHAGTPPRNSPGIRAVDPAYQTQPATRELPLRYSFPTGPASRVWLAHWTEAGWRANALDHTPEYPGQPSLTIEQFGPHRTSRAFAMLHLAMYDALNAITRRYPPYAAGLTAHADSSPDAAIAQSAHDVLAALYPRQRPWLDRWLSRDLATLPATRATRNGIDLGRRAAAAIVAMRASDGALYKEPVVGEDYFPGTAPGLWRPDPVSQVRIALGANWARQVPFVLQQATRYDAPPPALDSEQYTRAFNEVKALGGDGVRTATTRTAEQTSAGIFWSYDGVAWLGTAPRLYSQIALQIASQRSRDPLELARTMALVNVAVGDATMAVWHTKYHYDFWRPVTAIREASPGSLAGATGDGNPDTRADPVWTPLGSPASNIIGPNFTPPFPAYTSGHAGLGSAMFQVLRRLYRDQVPFTFVSDELNGITRDNRGQVRPRRPRSFATLSQAEEENGQSRIYLGVHWAFDKTEGIATGRRVADAVLRRGLVPPAP